MCDMLGVDESCREKKGCVCLKAARWQGVRRWGSRRGRAGAKVCRALRKVCGLRCMDGRGVGMTGEGRRMCGCLLAIMLSIWEWVG